MCKYLIASSLQYLEYTYTKNYLLFIKNFAAKSMTEVFF